MKFNPARMSRNAKLGGPVCVLGLIAAFAGSPYRGASGSPENLPFSFQFLESTTYE
jgi:hypothetical protein